MFMFRKNCVKIPITAALKNTRPTCEVI